MVRPLTELRDVDEPAWPELQRAIEDAGDRVSVRPVDRKAGEECLYRLQVTARSPLGALALETGGLLIDHGWIRIYGGGSDHFPDLATVNGLRGADHYPPGYVVVGTDVLGGQFAVNGGALDGARGEVNYFGPDTLGWDSLGLGHGDWLQSAISGVDDFYEPLRWADWRSEVEQVRPDEGISCYPFLCTAQGKNVGNTARRVVPWEELCRLFEDLAQQVGALPEGAAFKVRVEE